VANIPNILLLCCVALMPMGYGTNRDLDKTMMYSFYI